MLTKKGAKVSPGWCYHIYYHEYAGGYTTVHICQNSWTLTSYFNLLKFQDEIDKNKTLNILVPHYNGNRFQSGSDKGLGDFRCISV